MGDTQYRGYFTVNPFAIQEVSGIIEPHLEGASPEPEVASNPKDRACARNRRIISSHYGIRKIEGTTSSAGKTCGARNRNFGRSPERVGRSTLPIRFR